MKLFANTVIPLFACSSLLGAPAIATLPRDTAETPREMFNTGTRLFQEAKLREAEIFLESALGAQQARLQPTALYNLGHVRFAQGLEELKKGPKAPDALRQSDVASTLADRALKEAEEALQQTEVQRMIAAYLRGAGARKTTREALTAVKRAIDAYSAALLRLQRASGDFHSAVELQPRNADARHNADVVDRHIARLIDSLQQLQQMAAQLGGQREDLKEKMKQLRGKIPEPEMPPGAAGEDEEEEEAPSPQPGEKEVPTREGQRMELTPEQATWLLDGFRLDRERRLPMGQKSPTEPKDRNRPNW